LADPLALATPPVVAVVVAALTAATGAVLVGAVRAGALRLVAVLVVVAVGSSATRTHPSESSLESTKSRVCHGHYFRPNARNKVSFH
jgi:hypothetical protein